MLLVLKRTVLGTQKNCLIETIGSFEHPKHMQKQMCKKIFTFLAQFFCLSKPVCLPTVKHIVSHHVA